MDEPSNDREQQHEATHAAQTASLNYGSDPHSAVRMRLAAVASELRKAAETADGARESLLKLALRFEQHAMGDDQ